MRVAVDRLIYLPESEVIEVTGLVIGPIRNYEEKFIITERTWTFLGYDQLPWDQLMERLEMRLKDEL